MRSSLFALALVAAPLGAQQVPDTLFTPTAMPRPAWVVGRGPRVLIDEGHANFHTRDGRFAPFARLLVRDGFRVGVHAGRFTAASLRDADVLVVANALADDGPWRLPTRPAFTAEEIAALEAWVRRGGSLWLIADHLPFGAAAAPLARAFGLIFHDGYALTDGPDPGTFVFRRGAGLGVAPLLAGIDSVVSFTGQGFRSLVPVTPLLTFDRRVTLWLPTAAGQAPSDTMPSVPGEGLLQGALLSHGRGRVAVFGEAAMFTAQLAGPNRVRIGFNAERAPKNAEFVVRVGRWLGGGR